jgi:hypothetical protein
MSIKEKYPFGVESKEHFSELVQGYLNDEMLVASQKDPVRKRIEELGSIDAFYFQVWSIYNWIVGNIDKGHSEEDVMLKLAEEKFDVVAPISHFIEFGVGKGNISWGRHYLNAIYIHKATVNEILQKSGQTKLNGTLIKQFFNE